MVWMWLSTAVIRAVGFVVAAKLRGIPREQDRNRNPSDTCEGAAPAHPSPLRLPVARAKPVNQREPKGDDNKQDRPAADLHDQCAWTLQLVGRNRRQRRNAS